MFEIHMGVPEMEDFWNALTEKVFSGKASKSEVKLYNLIGKAMVLLANNPRHPGLQSHEIEVLTSRYGTKVWCSYLQNNTPAAGRIFWSYGPDKGDITAGKEGVIAPADSQMIAFVRIACGNKITQDN